MVDRLDNKTKILQFLHENETEAYCDDCLSTLAKVTNRVQVNSICNNNFQIKKEKAICHRCKKFKITRSIKTNSDKIKRIVKYEKQFEKDDIPNSRSIHEYNFSLIQQIIPQHDNDGQIFTYSPQHKYDNTENLKLHTYGDGEFCKFKISANINDSGVYFFYADNEIIYIGETENLKNRINSGYGNISPRNCFEGGQRTNCKINKILLEYFRANKKVYLYFYKSTDYKNVEEELIAKVDPKYNDK